MCSGGHSGQIIESRTIDGRVADLRHEGVDADVRFHQVVRAPLDGLAHVLLLPRLLVALQGHTGYTETSVKVSSRGFELLGSHRLSTPHWMASST